MIIVMWLQRGLVFAAGRKNGLRTCDISRYASFGSLTNTGVWCHSGCPLDSAMGAWTRAGESDPESGMVPKSPLTRCRLKRPSPGWKPWTGWGKELPLGEEKTSKNQRLICRRG